MFGNAFLLLFSLPKEKIAYEEDQYIFDVPVDDGSSE